MAVSLIRSSWWLDDSALPSTKIWARLDVLSDGTAAVLDTDARLHTFADEEEARHFLSEDEYRPLEDLRDDGTLNDSVSPPLWPWPLTG